MRGSAIAVSAVLALYSVESPRTNWQLLARGWCWLLRCYRQPSTGTLSRFAPYVQNKGTDYRERESIHSIATVKHSSDRGFIDYPHRLPTVKHSSDAIDYPHRVLVCDAHPGTAVDVNSVVNTYATGAT